MCSPTQWRTYGTTSLDTGTATMECLFTRRPGTELDAKHVRCGSQVFDQHDGASSRARAPLRGLAEQPIKIYDVGTSPAHAYKVNGP
jgi:hypothetical protein